jgi:hypothetical protein
MGGRERWLTDPARIRERKSDWKRQCPPVALRTLPSASPRAHVTSSRSHHSLSGDATSLARSPRLKWLHGFYPVETRRDVRRHGSPRRAFAYSDSRWRKAREPVGRKDPPAFLDRRDGCSACVRPVARSMNQRRGRTNLLDRMLAGRAGRADARLGPLVPSARLAAKVPEFA